MSVPRCRHIYKGSLLETKMARSLLSNYCRYLVRPVHNSSINMYKKCMPCLLYTTHK